MTIKIPLDRIVPDSTFSGSLEEVKSKAQVVIDTYRSQIPTVPQIPEIPTLVQQYVPAIPSYAEVREYIDEQIAELKRKKQEAFINAQNEFVRKAEDAFASRKQMVANKTRQNVVAKTVLGRFNNR